MIRQTIRDQSGFRHIVQTDDASQQTLCGLPRGNLSGLSVIAAVETCTACTLKHLGPAKVLLEYFTLSIADIAELRVALDNLEQTLQLEAGRAAARESRAQRVRIIGS